jgi:hypothetical protein
MLDDLLIGAVASHKRIPPVMDSWSTISALKNSRLIVPTRSGAASLTSRYQTWSEIARLPWFSREKALRTSHPRRRVAKATAVRVQ